MLGLVAAASSLWWCALVIDVAHAVSGFVAASLSVNPGDLLRAPLSTLLVAVEAGSVGMAQILALLYLVYGFFVLYVLVQMVLRLALIDILLALAPIALGLWILPHTAGWGRHWLRLFMTTVFQQAVQLIALAFGFGFLNEYASVAAFEPVQDLIWKLLMSLAFVYMATKVPSMLGNAGTFDSWLSTLYFGMNLPSSLMRSAKTIGLLAGGAAGGPGGAAVGAMAASAGLSAAASGISSAASLATPSGGRQRAAQEQRPGARASNDNPMGADKIRVCDYGEEVQRCAGRRANSGTECERLKRRAGRKPCETRKEKKAMEQLTQTISNLVGILLGVVGVVGVGFFVFGAYMYLTASGAPQQMERGKSAMMTALAGIILAMVAYGVVELVMNAVVGSPVDVSVPDPTTGGTGETTEE